MSDSTGQSNFSLAENGTLKAFSIAHQIAARRNTYPQSVDLKKHATTPRPVEISLKLRKKRTDLPANASALRHAISSNVRMKASP